MKVAKRFYGQDQGHRGVEGRKILKTRRMKAEALDVGLVVHLVGTVWSSAGCDGFECLANIKGVSAQIWIGASGFVSVGEVLAEANERSRSEQHVSWSVSQWDEVAFGSRKYHKGKRVRHSGAQWALTGVRVEDGRTREVECHFVP